jgi:protease YdgD
VDRSARCLLTLMIAVLGATGAFAEDAGKTVPPAIAAAAGWLGWAAAPVAGKGCTAVLVAPNAVLTAAHCVTRDPAVAPPVPEGLIFVPGWGSAGAQPTRRAISIQLPAPRDLLGGRLQYDLALVRLDAAVAGPDPLLLAPASDADGQTVAIGYASASPDHVSIADCVRVLYEAPVLGLDCPALPGFSGGPVVVKTDSGWRLAAIMVARGTGASLIGTYALRPSDDLMALLAGR